MNIKNWKKVRDAIANEIYGFDMETLKTSQTDHPCGTAACIAGTANLIKDGRNSYTAVSGWHSAVRFLELNYLMGEDNYVFLGEWIKKPITRITRADAVRYMDKAIAEKTPMVTIEVDEA